MFLIGPHELPLSVRLKQIKSQQNFALFDLTSQLFYLFNSIATILQKCKMLIMFSQKNTFLSEYPLPMYFKNWNRMIAIILYTNPLNFKDSVSIYR